MDSYLVTGGAGFIGSTFVKALVADGDHVVNLDKLTYAGEGSNLEVWRDNPLHTLVVGDIADKELVSALLDQHQPRYVVNFAAESHVDRSIDDPVPFLQSNVTGCVHLLEQVRKYWDRLPAPRRSAFRYLQVSTDEVYGTLGAAGCFVETTAYAPNSPYAASKAAADHFVRAYHRTFGVPTLTTHSTNNYGPFQHVEKLIPRVIVNALTGRPIPVYGDGLHVRDWLHVEDHVEALRVVLGRGKVGERYNIGCSCEVTNLALVRKICQYVDQVCGESAPQAEALITFVPDRPGHDRRYAINASKLRELGWTPSSSLDQGLEATVRWYRDRLDCWTSDANVEAEKRRGLLTREAGE